MFDQQNLLENCPPEQVWLVFSLYAGLLAAGIVLDVILCLSPRFHGIDWAGRTEALRSRPLLWQDLGLLLSILLLFLGLSVLATHWLAQDALCSNEQLFTGQVILQSLTFHAAGLLLVATILWRRQVGWGSAFGFRRARLATDLGLGVVFYAAVMPLLFFAALVFHFLLSYLGYPTSLQDIAMLLSGAHNPWAQAYLFFVTVALAPLVEELLFRGWALPLLARRLGVGPAVLITSAAFAVMHWHAPSFAPLFVIATAFAMAYLYSGSLLVPIVMHALFNGVNLAILLVLRN